MRSVMVNPRRASRSLVVAASVLVTVLAFSAEPIVVSAASGANDSRSKVPACRATQMRVSMTLPKTPYSPNRGFHATIWYTNEGATCYVTPDNLAYVAVSGPNHTVVGSSISGTVAYQSFNLEHGRQAFAAITIASISTPAFKKMVRTHGGSCTPKLADGIVLFGLGHNWPSKYIRLPEKVPVCTTDYYNVEGNVVAKKLAPGAAGQVAMRAGASELQDYLNLWRVSGPKAAVAQYLSPSPGSNTLLLRSGTVTSWRPSAWTSSNRFTLLVTLDLHFIGSPGAWNVGENDRFVSFTKSTPFGAWRISIFTGP